MKELNRTEIIRPLSVAIMLSVLLEVVNFSLFAFLNQVDQHLLAQFVWTVLIGGIALGATLGVFIEIIVVGRLEGKEAIQGTTVLTALISGIVGKLFSLGFLPLFLSHSIVSAPFTYFFVGLGMAIAGGYVLGYLLFTEGGSRLLSRLGL